MWLYTWTSGNKGKHLGSSCSSWSHLYSNVSFQDSRILSLSLMWCKTLDLVGTVSWLVISRSVSASEYLFYFKSSSLTRSSLYKLSLSLVDEEKFPLPFSWSNIQIDTKEIKRRTLNLFSFIQDSQTHERYRDRKRKWATYVILSSGTGWAWGCQRQEGHLQDDENRWQVVGRMPCHTGGAT